MSSILMEKISSQELQNAIIEGVKLQLKELKESFQPKEPNPLLTRSETAEMLKIDLSTLYLWSKQGKLIRYGLGNRVYYKLADVEGAIVKLKS